MSAVPTIHTESKKAHGGLYIALAPWVAFSVVARFNVQAAAAVALIGAIAIAVPSIRRHNPKTLEIGTAAAFACIAAASFLLDSPATHQLALYARGIAAALLALIAFGSLLLTPFTEQYARESVPRKYWGSSQFHALNRKLTATWGLVFAAMVPFHVVAGQIDTTRGNLIFNWGIPFALVLWGTKRTTALSNVAKG